MRLMATDNPVEYIHLQTTPSAARVLSIYAPLFKPTTRHRMAAAAMDMSDSSSDEDDNVPGVGGISVIISEWCTSGHPLAADDITIVSNSHNRPATNPPTHPNFADQPVHCEIKLVVDAAEDYSGSHFFETPYNIDTPVAFDTPEVLSHFAQQQLNQLVPYDSVCISDPGWMLNVQLFLGHDVAHNHLSWHPICNAACHDVGF